METKTLNEREIILQNNLDYTIFSWQKQSGLNPLNICDAKGVYIHDRSGKRYMDFSSQLMNMNIGHGHPRVKDAVMRQMDEVSFVHPGMITKARGELGKKLAEITPGSLKKTFFTNAGAEAVENAIKFARLYTGRHKVVTLYQGYHGASYGAMSASGDPRGNPHDSQGAPPGHRRGADTLRSGRTGPPVARPRPDPVGEAHRRRRPDHRQVAAAASRQIPQSLRNVG